MRKIVYYIASSVDGYIAGPGDNISEFVQSGDGVERYMSDLQTFDTVIMGRRTYEFGYQYGLQPGQPAYPHMDHYIFSNSLSFNNPHEQVNVCSIELETVKQLKEKNGSGIYLCGGGVFAGWLLDHQMIDVLKVKLNPFIQGDGIPLFGESKKTHQLQLTDSQLYENGLQFLSYDVSYS